MGDVLFARGERSMGALSDDQASRARKNESAILKALASVGQRNLADALGIDESAISRLKSDGQVERFSTMLAVLGLKVVPTHMHCYEGKSIEALLTLAKERLAQIEQPEQLAWDDE